MNNQTQKTVDKTVAKRSLNLLMMVASMVLFFFYTQLSVHAGRTYTFDISQGDIRVEVGTNADTLKVTYGNAQVADYIPSSQEITVTGSTYTNKVVVNIQDKTANITIQDLDIQFDASNTEDPNYKNDCPFSVRGAVYLTLAGENTLKETEHNTIYGYPGLRVEETGYLTIQGSGSLNASGGSRSAGIGGGWGGSYGAITITGGTITAVGGGNGAGIGGGYQGTGAGAIQITGGSVTATGSVSGYGIGRGADGYDGIINISSGATVKASAHANSVPATAVPAIGPLQSGSTAHILMAKFTMAKEKGTTTNLYRKSDNFLISSFAPARNYQSVAFTVPNADTYQLKTDGALQQHGTSPATTDFIVTSAGSNEFTDVTTKTYSVTYTLDDLEGYDWPPSEVAVEFPLNTKLTPISGYNITNAIAVTMGGTTLTAGTDYTYTITTSDVVYGAVYIPSVTGDVVITAAGVPNTYSITYNLTYITATGNPASTSKPTSVNHGQALNVLLTPDRGYVLPYNNVTVKMGETTLADEGNPYNGSSGGIYIYSVSDNVYITATGVLRTPPEGNGTSSDPYKISSESDLIWVSENNATSSGFAGKYFLQTQDLTMSSGTEWIPVGDDVYSFGGTYDGNGYHIEEIQIGTSESPNTNNSYLGLFGFINQGTVRNLNVEVHIFSDNSVLDADDNPVTTGIGGIAAALSGGSIYNCSVSGNVYSASPSLIGGVVGMGLDSKIVNVFTRVDLQGGEEHIMGGIAGAMLGSTEGGSTIANCIATGNIEGGDDMRIDPIGLLPEYRGSVIIFNNYWNEEAEYKGKNYYDANNPTPEEFVPLSENELKSLSEYPGTDKYFVSVLNDFVEDSNNNTFDTPLKKWKMDTDRINEGYPLLDFSKSNASSDATLSSLSLSGSTSLSPTFASQTTSYTARVANGRGSITVTPTINESHATVTVNGITVTSGAASGNISLNIGSNTINVVVTAQDRTTSKTYSITVTRAAGSSGGDAPNGSAIPVIPGIEIVINGKAEKSATATTKKVEDKTVTTITLNDKNIEERLLVEGNNATIIVPVKEKADVVVGQLNGQTVKNMERKDAVLEIKTENVTYTLPAAQINIDKVSEQIGTRVALEDIKVNLSISGSSADTVKIVQDTADKNKFQVVIKPIEFEITCTSGDKTVAVSKFNSYVERTVAIPEGIDPGKITTGIVLNSDGTFSHVPTTITVIDGKYYAKINSLTNSTYSLIWHPLEFKDVANHWAKGAVNDMGSRLVVSGIGVNGAGADGFGIEGVGIDGAGNQNFAPDREITRAEFAAIMVRALGLKEEDGATEGGSAGAMGASLAGATETNSAGASGSVAFTDVKSSDWFRGYIKAAVEYGLIKGYDDNTFKPNASITREEAMAIIARAMKWTGLETEYRADELAALYSIMIDTDSVAAWAKGAVGACLKNGIITGRDGLTIAPKASITRAETAAMAQRLLKKSGLID